MCVYMVGTGAMCCFVMFLKGVGIGAMCCFVTFSRKKKHTNRMQNIEQTLKNMQDLWHSSPLRI